MVNQGMSRPFFTGAVGNARWAGAPLAPLLQRAWVAADPYLASRVTYWENNGQITRRVLIP